MAAKPYKEVIVIDKIRSRVSKTYSITYLNERIRQNFRPLSRNSKIWGNSRRELRNNSINIERNIQYKNLNSSQKKKYFD
jgi:hypothetical protein